MSSEFIPEVNAKVYFGREHGERTLGKVVKVNRSACKVEQLEKRGSVKDHEVGTVWTVPFTLLWPTEGSRPASTPPPAVDEISALRAELAAAKAEIERLKSRTAHVRVASTPAMPAVRPARRSARAS